jgi:hypothetical protein
MSKTIVTSYGVHHDVENTAWLEQGRSGVNVAGLNARSPFAVRTPHGRHCNHQINLAEPIPNDRHWEMFMHLQSDPLVRVMMPFPKAHAGLYYVLDRPRLTDVLVMLSRMSSPIHSAVIPFHAFEDARSILKALGETNVQPLVLTGVQAADSPMIRELAVSAASRPRKLVVTSVKDVVVPTIVRQVDTQLTTDNYDFNELNVLPWEVLGATALRKWMRREWASEKTSIARLARTEA